MSLLLSGSLRPPSRRVLRLPWNRGVSGLVALSCSSLVFTMEGSRSCGACLLPFFSGSTFLTMRAVTTTWRRTSAGRGEASHSSGTR